jgi:hypothetical protein
VPAARLDETEPVVLLAFADDVPPAFGVPPAFVWFLSRTILLLTSQQKLEAVPLDPAGVPVPCAFAAPATATSTTPVIAARPILFMLFSPLQFAGKNADKPQCGRQSPVPLILQMHRIAHFQSAAAYGRAVKGHVEWVDLKK